MYWQNKVHSTFRNRNYVYISAYWEGKFSGRVRHTISRAYARVDILNLVDRCYTITYCIQTRRGPPTFRSWSMRRREFHSGLRPLRHFEEFLRIRPLQSEAPQSTRPWGNLPPLFPLSEGLTVLLI